MQIEWLGHAGFRITTNNKVLYIDPYQGDFDSAPKADIILITHAHPDHFVKANIEKLRVDSTEIIGPAKVIAEVDGSVVKGGSIITLKDLKIEAVAAYNIEKPHHPKGEGVGFIIHSEDKKIYHAGDTDLTPEMNAVEADVVLLPVGGTYTMDASDAASAAQVLSPDIAIPMHYGSIVGHVEDALFFKEEVEKNSEIVVKILKVNEVFEL